MTLPGHCLQTNSEHHDEVLLHILKDPSYLSAKTEKHRSLWWYGIGAPSPEVPNQIPYSAPLAGLLPDAWLLPVQMRLLAFVFHFP